MVEIKDRIKEQRILKDLNQSQLGKQLSVSKQTVSGWENGYRTPDIVTVTKLADFFNCSTDYLFGRTDNPSTKLLKADYQGDQFEVEVDKDYPHDLTPSDVESLLEQLKKAGFDVDTLIKNAKNK